MAIYKITNKLNGMVYIGQTVKENPFDRINLHFVKSNHNRYFLQRAIEKYGKDSFEITILDPSVEINQLNDLERLYISQYNSLVPNGYNLKAGGEQGGQCSDVTKKAISIAKTGKETAAKGKPKSDAHKLAMSVSRKGKQTPAQKLVLTKAVQSLCIKITAVNIVSKEQRTFASIEECARQLALSPSCISRVLSGAQNRTQHKGWTFKRESYE